MLKDHLDLKKVNFWKKKVHMGIHDQKLGKTRNFRFGLPEDF